MKPRYSLLIHWSFFYMEKSFTISVYDWDIVTVTW